MFLLKNFSITTKIVTMAAVLAGVFLLSAVGYIVLNADRELRESETDFLVFQVNSEAEKLEENLDDISSVIFFLSQTPPIQGFFRANANDGFDEIQNSTFEQWKERFETILLAEMIANPVFDQLRYIDETGQEVVRVERRDSVAYVVPTEELQDKSNREYFKQSAQLGPKSIYKSRVELNREGPNAEIELPFNPVIRYAVPVFDDQTQENKGIVIGNVSYYRLLDQDFSSNENHESNVYIIDEDGFFLTTLNVDDLWGGPNNLDTGLSVTSQPAIFSEVFTSNNNGSSFSNDSIYAYAKIYIDGDRYWTIVREVTTAQLFNDIHQLTKNVVLISVLIFIILFFVFLISIKNLISPLKKLEEAAQEIGEGNFDQRIEINTKDEVGSLAESVNTMAAKLKDVYGKLEEKIATRTRELSEQKARIEALIPRFPLGIVVEDEDRKIVITNDRYAEIFKADMTVEMLVGSDTRLAITSTQNIIKDFDGYIKRVEQIIAAGEEVVDEKVSLSEGVHILRSYIPLYDGPTFRGGLWTYQDITEAERISSMKTDFVSMVSHQLKTPVAQIKGFVSNMLDGLTGELTEEQKKYLTYIDNVATKNGQLVDSLLNVSRIERGILTFEKTRVDINKLMDDVMINQSTYARDRGIKLELSKPESGAIIEIDVPKTTEAINNIVNNAIKFSPTGQTVHMTATVDSEQVILNIIDHGPGIDKDVQTELFEKERVWSGKIKASGAGLGLYLSKKFINLQGGTINFTTSEQGTIFKVVFPLSK